MSDAPLIVAEPAPGLRVLTLNRPGRLNALNAELADQLRGALRRFSMPWSRPTARMREFVLMTPFFSPGPNKYGRPRCSLQASATASY